MAKDEEKIDISYETLWKFIIRPPRDIYDESELGDCVFSYRNRIYIRKDFNLLSSQGYLMKCSFIEPDEEERPSKIMPVVIYLHCNSSCRIEGINMATYLLRNDINLFVFDFPGSGLSEGEFISLGYHEKDDVKIVVDYVERLPGVGRIGLWGRSMGAATTMLYAHTDPRISCVVMDSPFADFYELSKELTLQKVKIPNLILDVALSIIRGTIKKKNGMDITKLKPIEACDKPNPPALFIHALEDEMVPIEHSLRLNQRYNGEKSLVSCKGGHNSARPKMVLERIQKFLCKYLKLEEKKIDEKPKILNDKEILIDPIPSKEPEEDEEIEDSEEEYEEGEKEENKEDLKEKDKKK